MIQERLTLAYTLPNVSHPPVILQPVSATSRFMMIGISSKTIEPTELSLLARWTIKPKLVGVPGVANVAIWGQKLRQMHVHIDPNRLRDARLIQEDIIAAAGDSLWFSPLTFLRGSAAGHGRLDRQPQSEARRSSPDADRGAGGHGESRRRRAAPGDDRQSHGSGGRRRSLRFRTRR